MKTTSDKYARPTWAFIFAGVVAVLGLAAVVGLSVARIQNPESTTPETQAAGTSTSKLGIFVQGNNDEAKKIVNAGPVLVKIVVPDPNAFLRDEGAYGEIITLAKNYKAKYPTGVVLIRFNMNEMGQTKLTDSMGADDAAEIVFNDYEQILKKLRDRGDMKYFDYIAGPTNETERVPFWSKSDSDMYWLARFWDTLTKLNSYAGMKTCVGNILTGDLPMSSESIKTLKAGLIPTMNSTKSVFCYHGYSDAGFTKTYESQKEQSLAFRDFYSKLGSGAPKMIIGELGIAGGWKVGTPTQYEDWLTWYDSEIKKDSQIIGAAIYEVGSSGADQIDGPVASWLVSYLQGQEGTSSTSTTGSSSTSTGLDQACFDNCFKNIKPGNGSYCRTACQTGGSSNSSTTGSEANSSVPNVCKDVCVGSPEHKGNFSYCTTCCGNGSCSQYNTGSGSGFGVTVNVKYEDGTNATSGTVRMGGTSVCTACNSSCKDPVCNPQREKAIDNGVATWVGSTKGATYGFFLVGQSNLKCEASSGGSCTITIPGNNPGDASGSAQVNACWGNADGLGGRCYDCNGDNTINILDFACFASHWLEEVL